MKMIIMDLDGTLLNRDLKIIDLTRETLMSYQKAGISLVLSSGRDVKSVMEVGHGLLMEDYPQNLYVCLNGLDIYNNKGELVHEEQKLSRDDAIEICNIAKGYHMDILFFFEKEMYALEYAHTGMINDHFMTTVKHPVQSVEEIPEHEFTCLKKIAFLQSEDVILKDLIPLQKEINKHYDLCKVEDTWLEINPKGLSKGHALEVISQLKNIPLSEMIAFGNGENDIDMLKTAGVGVAMENSYDTVKAAADVVCRHCDDNGIAHYLLENYPL